MPNFETFAKRSAPAVRAPLLTIQKRGTISINPAAHEAIGSPSHVELLFDAADRVVGLRGVDEGSSDAYPLRTQGKSGKGPLLVSGRAFTRYYDIDTTITRRWVAQVEDGVVFARLDDEHATLSVDAGSE